MALIREAREALALVLILAYLIVRPTIILSILVAYLRLADRHEEDKYIWGGMAVGLILTMGFLLSLHDPTDHGWIFGLLFPIGNIAIAALVAITALRLYRQGWMIRNAFDSRKSALQISGVDLWSFALLAGLTVSVSLQMPIFFMFLLFPSVGVPILFMVITVCSVVISGSAHIGIEKSLSVAALVLLLTGASFLREVPTTVALWVMGPLTGAEQLEWFSGGVKFPELISAVSITLYLAATLALLYRQRTSVQF